MQGFVKTLIQINSQSGHFPYLLTDAERCCIVLTRNVFSVTMQDDARETVRRTSALSGLSLAEERLAALAATLPFVQVIVSALAAVDYRDADPASPLPARPRAAR